MRDVQNLIKKIVKQENPLFCVIEGHGNGTQCRVFNEGWVEAFAWKWERVRKSQRVNVLDRNSEVRGSVN